MGKNTDYDDDDWHPYKRTDGGCMPVILVGFLLIVALGLTLKGWLV